MDSVNQAILRDINSGSIFRVIHDHAPISRRDIGELLKLAPSTISVITKDLQDRNLIRECGRASSTLGRRRVLLDINPPGGHFICADLSGSLLNVSVLDLRLQQIQTWAYPMTGKQGESLFAFLLVALQSAYAWCQSLNHAVFGIGIATPGLVDPSTGIVVEADNLAWHHVDLQSRLEEQFDCQIWIENDTNMATYGEYRFGDDQDQRLENMMLVTIGTGIGAGLILNGEMYSGSSGMAGEIGHVVVIMDGPMCICGNRGCLESIASAQSLIRDYARLTKAKRVDLTIEELVGYADAGDQVAIDLIHRAGRAIGQVVGGQVNILNLNRVVFGGIALRNGVLFDAIKRGIGEAVLPNLQQQLDVRTASLGRQAALVGMAALGLDRMMRVMA